MLSSIELAGEGSRMPIISDMFKLIFNMDVSKTMIIDECIAKGCCFYVNIL